MIGRYKFSEYISPCSPEETPNWVDLSDPEEAELAEISRLYNAPPWFLADSLDPKERPRVDQDEAALLVVARLSTHEVRPDGPHFQTVPVGLVIFPGLVITICRTAGLVSGLLERLFTRKRHWSCLRLVMALFHASGTGFIDNLEKMEDQAGEAEARLRRSPENAELLAILNIEKALIDITLALKSNHELIGKFNRSEPFGLTLTKDERDLLDDAITENQQAIFMAEIFGQILSSMSNAFGSIISNNLNKTMKFLAGVTIVLMLPTIIAGLYGMNVGLPLAGAPGAFIGLCALALGLMLAVSVLFAKKKWF